MNRRLSSRSIAPGIVRVRKLAAVAPLRGIGVSAVALAMFFAGLVAGPAASAGAATSPATQVVGGVNNPSSVVVDAAGNVFITNSGDNSIIVVPKTTGTIFGQAVTANIPVKLAAATGLEYPNDLAFESGNLYVSNFNNGTVSVIPATSGVVFGQEVTANTAATLNAATGISNPIGIAFDAGNLFVTNHNQVTVVPATTSTIFGQQFTADTAATLSVAVDPSFGLAFDGSGDLYYASGNGIVVIPSATTTSVFGQVVVPNTDNELSGAGGSGVTGLAFDAAGDLFWASGNGLGVDPASTTTSVFGQTVTPNSPVGLSATGLDDLNNPQDISFDDAGNLYVGNFNGEVVTVLPISTKTLFGQQFTADVAAPLGVSDDVNQAQGLAFDSAGDLFIANYGNETITVIAKSSTTIFGQSFTAGVPTTLTVATSDLLSEPTALAFDTAGDLFISNNGNNSITVIPAATETIFGQAFTVDTAATLTAAQGIDHSTGIAFDSNGDLFIANADNYVTVIPATTGSIFGQPITTPDAMVGLNVTDGVLNNPGEMAFDSEGNLFVANTGNSTVTVIPAATGTLFGQSMTANTPVSLNAATGVGYPTGLAVDAAGNLYLTDGTTWAISVIARASATLYGQSVTVDVPTTLSAFSSLVAPRGLALDGNGDLYESDLGGVSYVAAPSAPQTPTPPTSLTSPPPTTGTIPSSTFGAPTTLNASSTIPSTVTATSGNASETITVPAGALPTGTSVSIYPVTNTAPLVSQVPAGSSYVLAFAVTWETTTGSTPSATTPITATINDPSIVAGDTIYEITPTGVVEVATATTNGTITFTFSSDPIFVIGHATVAPQPSPHASRVDGSAVAGKTVTLKIVGSHFYGQPKITSNGPGTRVVVSRDTGTLLTLRVSVSAHARAGVHTFTVRLADGASCTVRYSLK